MRHNFFFNLFMFFCKQILYSYHLTWILPNIREWITICLVFNYCKSDCRLVLLFRMGIVLLNKQNMLRHLQPLIWTEPAVVKSFKQPSLNKQTAELKVFELPKAKKANRKFVLNHCRYNSQNPLSKVCFIAKCRVACINILYVVICKL